MHRKRKKGAKQTHLRVLLVLRLSEPNIFKNPFGNEVASAFCLKRRYNPFGKQKNTFSRLVKKKHILLCMGPYFFASETQEKKKQHFAALWTLFTLNLISMNSVAHTVHLKNNEQCNSLALFKSELHCSRELN